MPDEPRRMEQAEESWLELPFIVRFILRYIALATISVLVGYLLTVPREFLEARTKALRDPVAAVETRALAAMRALRPLTLGALYLAALQPDPDLLAGQDAAQAARASQGAADFNADLAIQREIAMGHNPFANFTSVAPAAPATPVAPAESARIPHLESLDAAPTGISGTRTPEEGRLGIRLRHWVGFRSDWSSFAVALADVVWTLATGAGWVARLILFCQLAIGVSLAAPLLALFMSAIGEKAAPLLVVATLPPLSVALASLSAIAVWGLMIGVDRLFHGIFPTSGLSVAVGTAGFCCWDVGWRATEMVLSRPLEHLVRL